MYRIVIDLINSIISLFHPPIPEAAHRARFIENRERGKSSISNVSSRVTLIRLRPVVILIVLIFLFFFNAIIVYSYGLGHNKIQMNLLIYMYIYFWLTFFLVAYQITKLSTVRSTKN